MTFPRTRESFAFDQAFELAGHGFRHHALLIVVAAQCRGDLAETVAQAAAARQQRQDILFLVGDVHGKRLAETPIGFLDIPVAGAVARISDQELEDVAGGALPAVFVAEPRNRIEIRMGFTRGLWE